MLAHTHGKFTTGVYFEAKSHWIQVGIEQRYFALELPSLPSECCVF